MDEISDVVKTRRLEIVDSRGQCAVLIDAWRDGQPYIRLYDRDGLERLVLSLDQKSQPQIGLLDREGRCIVGIGINDEMGAGLNVFDVASGALKIVAMVDIHGKAVLRTFEPRDVASS